MGCKPSSNMIVKTMKKTESCPNLNKTSKTIEKKQIPYKSSTWGGPIPSRKKTDLNKKQILLIQKRNKMHKRYKTLELQEIVQCQNQNMFELTINRNIFNKDQPKLHKSATVCQLAS